MNTRQAEPYLESVSGLLDVDIPTDLLDGVAENIVLFMHHAAIVEQALAQDFRSEEV